MVLLSVIFKLNLNYESLQYDGIRTVDMHGNSFSMFYSRATQLQMAQGPLSKIPDVQGPQAKNDGPILDV